MKIKILKSSGEFYWYKKHIGETYKVYKWNVYSFIMSIFGRDTYGLCGSKFGKFVNKKDSEIIK